MAESATAQKYGRIPGAPAAIGAAGASTARGAPGIAAGSAQFALAWDAAGVPGQVQEAAEPRRRHYRGARGDWRRATEYLAARGPLPLENLHNIARMSPEAAVARLCRLTAMSRTEAYKEWRAVCVECLPYTAARLATLEGAAEVVQAMGAGLAHYLAASAATARGSDNSELSSNRDNGRNRPIIDSAAESLPSDTLPPKRED
jgi:hypothetical protein